MVSRPETNLFFLPNLSTKHTMQLASLMHLAKADCLSGTTVVLSLSPSLLRRGPEDRRPGLHCAVLSQKGGTGWPMTWVGQGGSAPPSQPAGWLPEGWPAVRTQVMSD